MHTHTHTYTHIHTHTHTHTHAHAHTNNRQNAVNTQDIYIKYFTDNTKVAVNNRT